MKHSLTIKDLVSNEDLNQYLTEDLEDFDVDTPVTYEVWTIGYNKDDMITDSEMFVAEFKYPDEAVAYANKLTLADIVHKAAEDPVGVVDYEEVEYISIEIETVIDEGVGETMNVGTIYKRELWLDGEYGDEDCIKENDVDPVVNITAKDYVLTEEGNLEIDCSLLKDYNKNDYVRIHFADEAESGSFTYKIISKTTANKYICEFIY